MTPKPKVKHRDLPPRMVKRQWKTRKGTQVAYYYEHPRDENGKRSLEPLGTDFPKAKLKWGEIEGIKMNKYMGDTLGSIYEKYMKWAENKKLSGLSDRTLKDRKNYWKMLEPVFANNEMNTFKSSWFMIYFEKRTSQVSAKKELKFLSVLFSWAKAYDLCDIENPVTVVLPKLKVKENRDILITSEEYMAVREAAVPFIRDLMDLMFMAGTRPEEALLIKFSDIKDGKISYVMGKVSRGESRAKIKNVIIGPALEKLIARRKALLHSMKVTSIDPPLLFDDKGNPLKLNGTVKYWWKQARDKSKIKRRYQLKDIRPFAATERFKAEGMEATRRLLGHSTESQTRTYIREYLGEEADSHESVSG